jgi:hypothetical protein
MYSIITCMYANVNLLFHTDQSTYNCKCDRFICRQTYIMGFHNYNSDISTLLWRKIKNNRFLHTFLGKTGWSSTSDRNFMSFREWSAAKRAKRNKNFYHEWKITRAFPTTHVSTYFFRKPTTFTIANS